jgi:hypothetical protein
VRVASAIALVLFGLAAAVQWNDPDAVGWIAVYLITAATALAGALGRFLPGPTLAIGVLLGIGAILRWPEGGLLPGADSMAMANLEVEETREALGLLLCSTWALFLAWAGRRRSGVVALLPLFLALGCSAVDGRIAGNGATVEVPLEMAFRPVPRLRVASDLANPRGMLVRGEELLVAVAGDGDPGRPASGGLLALADLDGDGRYESPGERRVLLEGRVSRNVIDIVRRDEVFGMAGIAGEGDRAMVSLAYFGGPSTISMVEGDFVRPWSRVFGNINDLTYDAARGRWIGVSSSSDEVVVLQPERGSRRLRKLPALAGGQDAVPGYVAYDAGSDGLLVSLFSGSTAGEEGGRGTELVPRAGGIVRIDPEDGALRWLVSGLTAPTDLEFGPDGRLYVLEFCDAFVDPIQSREEMWQEVGHGGFRRFSGRLLAIDLGRGTVEIIAEGLDGPTNLARGGRFLYVAQGMGTPGRPIPGPEGPVPLAGVIDRFELPVSTEPNN